MIPAAEISDEYDLESWLKPQQHSIAMTVAHRSAMRVAPLLFSFQRKGKNGALHIARALLTTGVAIEGRSASIKRAAAGSRTMAMHVASNINEALSACILIEAPNATAAHFAAESAMSLVFSATATPIPETYACQAVRMAFDATKAFNAELSSSLFAQVKYDCQRLEAKVDLKNAPIWGAFDNPLISVWDQVKDSWQDKLGVDEFWLRWYQAALDGTSLNQNLLRDIVLELTEEDWNAGPARVAERIAEIELRSKNGLAGPGQDGDPVDKAGSKAKKLNSKVILAQIEVLRSLVNDELYHFRGQNFRPDDDLAQIEKQTAVLEQILVLLSEIVGQFNNSYEVTPNALVVLDAKLPAIVEKANELVEHGGEPQVSAAIVSMAASTKLLTESGAPGSLALGIAFCDTAWKTMRNWVNKPK